MPLSLRGIPRLLSFLQLRFLRRLTLPPHAVVKAGGRLRVVAGLALAALCASQPHWAFAQSTAPPAESNVPDTAPVANVPSDPTKPLFEIPSAWDAPEPWRTDRFYLQFAYYTLHFHYDKDHEQSYLVDGEYHFNETWLGGQVITGLALFQNSFGQFSEYIFGGLVWRPLQDNQPFYVKLTAGPLHGYTGQYRDKVPFNSASGWAPAIIPGVGYCVKRYCGEFVLLGANAALFTVGVTMP
jgi:hypothetical protein